MFVRATIVAIEGGDRRGKATQSIKLVDALRERGHKVTRVEVPVRSPVTYRLIYWMLRNGLAKKFPTLFQFVQFMNKFMFQVTRLSFLERMYDFIVFDRWALSACVYGAASGVSREFNDRLYDMLRRPDMTFVLSGERCFARADTPDSYEADAEFQQRVDAMYKASALRLLDGGSCCVIPCEQDKEVIHTKVLSELSRRCLA